MAWFRLLKEGRFRIHPSRWPVAVGITLTTPVNTVLGLIQKVIFRRRLAESELHGPPVFVVGHWRSGTTLLHELMVMDERLSSPSTFQCFAPHHFLCLGMVFPAFRKLVAARQADRWTIWLRAGTGLKKMSSPYSAWDFPRRIGGSRFRTKPRRTWTTWTSIASRRKNKLDGFHLSVVFYSRSATPAVVRS